MYTWPKCNDNERVLFLDKEKLAPPLLCSKDEKRNAKKELFSIKFNVFLLQTLETLV